jgi:hypothetical protein
MTQKRVVLVNVSKRAEVFNLAHQIYCAGAGECRCRWTTLQLFPNTKTGAKKKTKKVRTCASITVQPREETPPLAPSVLEVPEVRSALDARPRRLIVRQNQNGG